MTKILAALGIAALSITVTACGSATSPASPTSVDSGLGSIDANVPTTPTGPNPGAKPGDL